MAKSIKEKREQRNRLLTEIAEGKGDVGLENMVRIVVSELQIQLYDVADRREKLYEWYQRVQDGDYDNVNLEVTRDSANVYLAGIDILLNVIDTLGADLCVAEIKFGESSEDDGQPTIYLPAITA